MALSKKISLLDFFNYCLQNQLPVAIYRLPGNHNIKVVAQKQRHLLKNAGGKNFKASMGFAFAPFKEDDQYTGFIIAPDIYTTSTKLPLLNFARPSEKHDALGYQGQKIKQSTRHQYIEYVRHIQSEIKKGNFKKVVAARVVKKKKPGGFNAVSFFQRLCKKYPNTFASLVYTPQYGTWIGASPEVLLTVNSEGFKTYSLAGTKANTANLKDPQFGEKEKEEQKIVSDFIETAFKKIAKSKPLIHGPEIVTAGNLLHLRTTFTFKNIALNKWPLVVSKLHPTPAVAGLPQNKSIDFITVNERAARSFYSGYLGPVNLDKQINLFVNLRCMQVLKNKLAVYVGCGITAHSKPSAEWKESKMKSETLLSVL